MLRILSYDDVLTMFLLDSLFRLSCKHSRLIRRRFLLLPTWLYT